MLKVFFSFIIIRNLKAIGALVAGSATDATAEEIKQMEEAEVFYLIL